MVCLNKLLSVFVQIRYQDHSLRLTIDVSDYVQIGACTVIRLMATLSIKRLVLLLAIIGLLVVVLNMVAVAVIRSYPPQTSTFTLSSNTSLLDRIVQQRDELSKQLNLLQVRKKYKIFNIGHFCVFKLLKNARISTKQETVRMR